ncbi:MAG TPA: hypothetical protein VGG39_00590 [Polyangiaceae bacterium]|jgi:hypothetical protein
MALLVAPAGGCSVLLDWNDFSGGIAAGDDGGPGSDAKDDAEGGGDAAIDGAGTDAPPEGAPTTCSSGMQCVAAPPSGWTGPVALYAAASTAGSAPACGTGFSSKAAFDGNGGNLTAASPTCSPCGCGTASGEVCNGPLMTFYIDGSCTETIPVDGTLTVTTTCNAANPLAASVTVAGPTVSSGTCGATGGAATLPAAVWDQTARACAPSSPVGPADCAGGQVCMPASSSPFSSGACVWQAGTATGCPAGYPTGPQVFYSGVADQRGCTACQCSPSSGATCMVSTPAIESCEDGTTFDAPSACAPINTVEEVKLTANMTLTPGTCGVAGGGAPTGTATPSGATSFCCAP